MGLPTRIDELRRRVDADPASIAFAQLAEEYRREGQLAEAVETCRAGLRTHPSYHSARVTLGRALLALGHAADAAVELQQVLDAAPDHVAAQRALAEVHLSEPQPPGAAVWHEPAADGAVAAELERWLEAIHAARTDRHA